VGTEQAVAALEGKIFGHSMKRLFFVSFFFPHATHEKILSFQYEQRHRRADPMADLYPQRPMEPARLSLSLAKSKSQLVARFVSKSYLLFSENPRR
jgi:hypothetical protein